MKLDDFNSTFNSAKVSKVLEDKFGTKVDLNKLNLKQLRTLKVRVTEAHRNMVKSTPFNSGHRNPEYLEQVALLEAIELKINEVASMSEGASEVERLKKQIKQLEQQARYYSHEDSAEDPETGHGYRPNYIKTLEKIEHLQKKLKQAKKQSVNEVEQVEEVAPKGWEGTVKAMKKHKEIDNPWALANYMKKKGYKSHVDEVKDEENNEPKSFSNFTGTQSSALLRLVGTQNLSKAKRAIQLASEGKPIPGNLVVGFKPIVDIVLDILKGGSSYVRRLQSLDKQASQLGESRYLAEGETEKAQLIMAVKDMVDRVQGMVEDLNKMKVEDLVALTDKMRDEFGQDQATSFTSGANDILSAGIDALTNARTEMDNAVLALTGEAPAAVPGAEMPVEPGAEVGADMGMQPGAEAGAEMPTEPGAELPPPEGGEELGRELRESRKRARRKVLESSRFLGKLAK